MTPVVGAHGQFIPRCRKVGHSWSRMWAHPRPGMDEWACEPGAAAYKVTVCSRCGGVPRPSSDPPAGARCAICTRVMPTKPSKNPDAPRDAHMDCVTNARAYLEAKT